MSRDEQEKSLDANVRDQQDLNEQEVRIQALEQRLQHEAENGLMSEILKVFGANGFKILAPEFSYEEHQISLGIVDDTTPTGTERRALKEKILAQLQPKQFEPSYREDWGYLYLDIPTCACAIEGLGEIRITYNTNARHGFEYDFVIAPPLAIYYESYPEPEDVPVEERTPALDLFLMIDRLENAAFAYNKVYNDELPR